ncbi:MAG: DNA/RNA nuclease SfsA [Aquificae bacterium]|nr:DNA/RNA nuclease SfsA [Aquificota bacterium]
MKLPPLIPAKLIARENKFRALVNVGGETKTALVRNTGRMEEFLKPGANVYLKQKETGKHPYEILLTKHKNTLVCVDSHIAVKLFEEYIKEKWKITSLKREVKICDVRIDLLADERLVEVKSVNLVKEKVALFPDAPTKRGTKHILTLSSLPPPLKPLLVFVVLRNDAESFRPNCETDPDFCKALFRYVKNGGEVLVLSCEVSLSEIKITRSLQFSEKGSIL